MQETSDVVKTTQGWVCPGGLIHTDLAGEEISLKIPLQMPGHSHIVEQCRGGEHWSWRHLPHRDCVEHLLVG